MVTYKLVRARERLAAYMQASPRRHLQFILWPTLRIGPFIHECALRLGVQEARTLRTSEVFFLRPRPCTMDRHSAACGLFLDSMAK